MKKSAVISECQKYRYVLTRVWDEKLPLLAIVGLNPSTADAEKDDATIRKCIRFARSWNSGGLVMLNLFAWRAREPARMKSVVNPVGPDNDMWLRRYSDDKRVVMFLAAWGNHGRHRGRDQEVLALLRPMYALKLNTNGTPQHPLYVPNSTTPFLIQ